MKFSLIKKYRFKNEFDKTIVLEWILNLASSIASQELKLDANTKFVQINRSCAEAEFAPHLL